MLKSLGKKDYHDSERFNIKKTYIELTKKVYEHTPAGVGGGIILAIITTLAFIHTGVDDAKLVMWDMLLVLNYLISFALYGLYKHFKPNDDHIIKWSYYCHASLICFGFTWGVSAFLLLPKIDPIMTSFLILSLIAVTTAFVQGTIGFTKTAITIALFTLSPITIISLLSNNFIISLMGLVSILVTIFTIVSASINSAVQKDSILKKYEINAKNKALAYQATHDALTGVANRSLLYEVFNEAIKENGNQKRMAVLFLDLDDFKKINDQWGHEAGDKLLICFVEILKNSIREGDLIIRLGGDEFLIFLESIKNEAEVNEIAQRILLNLKEQKQIGENKILISSSIGASFYPEDGVNIDALLKKADIALYQAKSSGKNSFNIIRGNN